jgi:hypothetical protein
MHLKCLYSKYKQIYNQQKELIETYGVNHFMTRVCVHIICTVIHLYMMKQIVLIIAK